MHAVQLTGHGGLDQLVYRDDIPVPRPDNGEVLIRVTAAGINNTDINTRIGWYSKTVTVDTEAASAGVQAINADDASWSGVPLVFPRIQGADVCGHIAAVGTGVDPTRVGERVLIQTMQPLRGAGPFRCITFGSECDGGFAQFTITRSEFAHEADCDWTDIELASIPCSYSTAENMLHRASLGAEHVLITGASGGVGSAAVQLAKRRGAVVTAIASRPKADEVATLGADRVIDRDVDIMATLGTETVDVVIDLVGGPQWPSLLDVLHRGGRYVTAGAIAGPMTELDLRTLYLKDLTLFGTTYQDDGVFPDLVSYVKKNEIRPIVARTYPLQDIAKAQEDFLAKKHAGKLVLVPPAIGE